MEHKLQEISQENVHNFQEKEQSLKTIQQLEEELRRFEVEYPEEMKGMQVRIHNEIRKDILYHKEMIKDIV